MFQACRAGRHRRLGVSPLLLTTGIPRKQAISYAFDASVAQAVNRNIQRQPRGRSAQRHAQEGGRDCAGHPAGGRAHDGRQGLRAAKRKSSAGAATEARRRVGKSWAARRAGEDSCRKAASAARDSAWTKACGEGGGSGGRQPPGWARGVNARQRKDVLKRRPLLAAKPPARAEGPATTLPALTGRRQGGHSDVVACEGGCPPEGSGSDPVAWRPLPAGSPARHHCFKRGR